MTKKILYILLLLLPLIGKPYIKVSATKGTLTATVKSVRLTVETDENPVFGIFHWDKSINLWVKVIGETGQLLGDFDMSEANMVDLRGTGTFILEVYSKGGTGNFECTFVNKDKGELSKKGEESEVHIFTGCDPLYVIYDWEDELEIGVKIVDEKDQVIADLDLSKGNVSKLIGGGKFSLRIYSTKGKGTWELYFLNQKEWNIRQKK